MTEFTTWFPYKIREILDIGGIVIVPMFALGTYGIFLLLQSFTQPAISGTKRMLRVMDSMILYAQTENGIGQYHDDNPVLKILWETLSGSTAETNGQQQNTRFLLSERLSLLFYCQMRHLVIIRVLAAAAPLLGLSGTVSGLIRTFDAMCRFGFGSSGLLSSGIAEALTATQIGLLLAILLLLTGQFQEGRIIRFKDEVESRITSLLRCLNEQGLKK
jgi:biopolymer transport protein ExbB